MAGAAAVAPQSSQAATASAAAASGPPIRWPVQRFVYKAESKRLSEVLIDFASSQGVAGVVAEGVDGVVQASFDTTPNEFLSAVSKAYGIIWYYDGAAIYFYPSRAIQSRIFRLKGYTGAQVDNLLRSLQLADRRYPLRYDRAESTLLVYGPPRHVELVSAAIESLDVGATDRTRRITRVFSLRYAWAGDRKLGDRVVPGMASVLRGLYKGEPTGTESDQTTDGERIAGKALAIQKQYGLDSMSPQLGHKSPQARMAESPERSMTGRAARGVSSPVGAEEDAPSFQADDGSNAVIVYGRADRMSEYAEVIRRLDVEPSLIEFEAMIIDVRSDSVDSLGINWSAGTARGKVSVTSPAGGTSDSGDAIASAAGTFTIGTVWANAGRELAARIHALAADGKAKVVATPRVLGVANRPAVMKEKRIVNVRVAGNLEANLYQVEAGTELQVTPQVTSHGTDSRLKLSLYIVDGNFEEATVDQVPILRRTEIVTEAYMNEGESLLIGGIAVESDGERVAGVPGLSRVPLVGALFRWNESSSARSERLFLITPRLLRDVELTGQAAGQHPQAVR
nr:type III secretion system outer membrane ring subunit SctC [Caldimonas mangrovi]